MESSIYIKKTKKTPLIYLDFEESIFQIKGASFSEDILSVYEPIITWINEYVPLLKKELVCDFYFTVLNSASHKKLFQILIMLEQEKEKEQEKGIKINWYYDEDDEDIMEMGEDLMELINMPFNLIPVCAESPTVI